MYLTYNVREYFESIKKLDNSKVLDFGCNHANFLLKEFNGKYIGVDVDNKVLKNNKNKFPQHTWIHYNKYNYQYNCNLHIVDTWPNLPNNIDTVIAFSVFTHTTFEEYQYTTSKLQQHLSNDGNILSTFFSSLDKKTLYSVLSHRPEYFKDCQEDIVDKLFKKDVIYLCVNTLSKQVSIFDSLKDLPKFSNRNYFLTFYNDQWLQDNLGGEIIDVTDRFTNILSTQKCLKLSTPR
jgi:hypothetical protein